MTRHEYYLLHREEMIEKAKERAKRDPLRRSMGTRARFANSRYPGKITADDLLEVLKRDGNRCFWCGKEDLKGFDLTIEHLQPVNHTDHLTIACRSCNGKRMAGTPHPEPLSDEERKQRHYESVRRWRETHPERSYAHDRLYKEQHQEELNARAREFKKAHRPEINEYKRQYRQDHPEER